jgi:PhoH-like ATPase
MLNERVYQRIMVTRPTVSLGPDIGFLPGDMDEKLENWMQPVFDNISMIIAGTKARKMSNFFSAEDLIKNKQLVLQAITYMRGRSLPRQFLFVDEAQNLTPLEVKTLVTRAGIGTKVILAGDPEQIDTKALNYDNNGLMVTTKKFRGEPLFGVVHLKRSERSELAQRAADLL